jgi:RNA polymerase sigma-70 factor (ECF subfamily)
MNQALSETKKVEQFKSWVDDYSDLLFSHAVFRGFDRDSAKDLVQDTFYSAWKNMDGFQGRASVKNWLFVILKNKMTDQFRKNAGHPKVLISEFETQFDQSGHWAKPSYPKELTINPDDISGTEFQQILDNCSMKLNKVQKAVFFMKYMDDLESDDICMQLSITANNYWTILHRAKVQLRACLERNWLLIKNA